MDPSPLNAQVSGLYIKGRKPSGPTINEVNRICLIIGNTHENAIKHIERARRGGIKAIGIKDSGGLSNYDEAIIGFELMRDKDYLNEDFIRQVAQFGALVSSGKADNLLVNVSRLITWRQ